MLRLTADENFHGSIVRALRRRLPALDLVTAQEADLRRSLDPAVLSWAAETDRVLLTHDVSTMVPLANERISLGQPMAGLFVIRRQSRIGPLIDDLLLLAAASEPDEWCGRVLWLPL